MALKFDSKALRKEMRQRRARLTPREQHKLSVHAFNQLKLSGLLKRHTLISAYLSDRGEIAPGIFFESLWNYKKKIALPVLHPIDKNKMLFVRYEKGDPLFPNRYGILEPKLDPRKIVPARFCGLVLCPLTAFDAQGNRMGMGGGFYDRSFAFKQKKGGTRPCLTGFAYEFQKVESLETQPWDVTLDAVVTDTRFYFPRKNRR